VLALLALLGLGLGLPAQECAGFLCCVSGLRSRALRRLLCVCSAQPSLLPLLAVAREATLKQSASDSQIPLT